jgi:hypothetical protein
MNEYSSASATNESCGGRSRWNASVLERQRGKGIMIWAGEEEVSASDVSAVR